MYSVSLESVVLVLVFNRGMRSGTVPHILAVGMGAACEIAQREMEVVWCDCLICVSRLAHGPSCSLLLLLSLCCDHLVLSRLMQYDSCRIAKLSQRLLDGIMSRLDHVVRNGDPEQTYRGERRISYLPKHALCID